MIVQDKVAIVTGASSGIGLEVAKNLCAHGGIVILASRSKEKLEALAHELPRSAAIEVDMRDNASIQQLVKTVIEQFGQIDILVNNAGVGYDEVVEKIDITKYQELFQVNVVGPLILMQQCIPSMRKTGEGAIVNISSGLSLMDVPNLSAYASVKSALNSLSHTAREELKKDNIAVSLVYPYVTNTNFGKNVLSGPRNVEKQDKAEVLPGGDDPKIVADMVLEVIESGESEIFAHDWMCQIK